MVDLPTVCCMCGDVGFPDKLFRCGKCHYRSQHSYCSNYYDQGSTPSAVCDWCQSEERSGTSHHKHGAGSSSKRSAVGKDVGAGSRSEYVGDRIKQQERDRESSGSDHRGKNVISGTPSPRPTGGRRYKLLKDVLC
ncbi:hypothetical protein H6P81_005190 [Aristolochia fimbriata]|uniref:PHD-type zinc finger plants domain-containing protein n=1 Tax=Aristolochia fimbriata TaxID=158543 RepID=A0AAV7EUX4_ARIFI|nr:hypothetical protein H6P81_005190 [Aristolochia fimbriata]